MVGTILAMCGGNDPLSEGVKLMLCVLPFVALALVLAAHSKKVGRRRRRLSRAALAVMGVWTLLLPMLFLVSAGRPHDTQAKLCVNNLRLIEDAIDEVMAESNFSSTASVTIEMVGERLRAGAISEMNWPRGVVPPDEKMIQTSETNGMFVERDGKRITTKRN